MKRRRRRRRKRERKKEVASPDLFGLRSQIDRYIFDTQGIPPRTRSLFELNGKKGFLTQLSQSKIWYGKGVIWDRPSRQLY